MLMAGTDRERTVGPKGGGVEAFRQTTQQVEVRGPWGQVDEGEMEQQITIGLESLWASQSI